jgi:hypothetical protein
LAAADLSWQRAFNSSDPLRMCSATVGGGLDGKCTTPRSALGREELEEGCTILPYVSPEPALCRLADIRGHRWENPLTDF